MKLWAKDPCGAGWQGSYDDSDVCTYAGEGEGLAAKSPVETLAGTN